MHACLQASVGRSLPCSHVCLTASPSPVVALSALVAAASGGCEASNPAAFAAPPDLCEPDLAASPAAVPSVPAPPEEAIMQQHAQHVAPSFTVVADEGSSARPPRAPLQPATDEVAVPACRREWRRPRRLHVQSDRGVLGMLKAACGRLAALGRQQSSARAPVTPDAMAVQTPRSPVSHLDDELPVLAVRQQRFVAERMQAGRSEGEARVSGQRS